jgi:hypothetical protein
MIDFLDGQPGLENFGSMGQKCYKKVHLLALRAEGKAINTPTSR